MANRTTPSGSTGFMAIGALARSTGVSVRAIRHYDELKLLASLRAPNGYRQFRTEAVTQVRQIQRMLGAGFSLEEVRTFPGCMLLIEGAAPCAVTTQTQRDRLAVIEEQIADLEQRRQKLLELLKCGAGDGDHPGR